MTTDRAKEFQVRITKEAIALLVIYGESVSVASSTEDISVAHFEQAVTLIGKTWNLPAEVTSENLSLIQKERDALRRIATGEDVPHVLPQGELPMSATGMETLDNVWDLFESAVQMDSQEQRTAMFKLASELAECQNLLDWIEKTPAERELSEIRIS